MAFRGWPAAAIEFFEGLEADNSKDYWTQHKDVYERSVRGPMEELLAELEPDFGPGKVFRPYRDVRFSKDKTPYKTNIAATAGEGYISLSAAGLGVGSGMYRMAPDQLARFRKAVDDDKAGQAIERIVAAIEKQGHECGPHDALKTAPKGYPKDHPRIELLRAKGIVTWHQWSPAGWLSTKKAKEKIVEVVRAAAPLNRWLDGHVGATTMDMDRR